MDILPDGSLDLPDSLLEEFDFVVASIHSRFNQDNTYRILKAMENPFVNLIGHPTGKAYGTRQGYPLYMERIIQMAKETNTALELNTYRADLSPENIRRCMEVGVMIAVVTDAHSTKHLFYMELGVGLAEVIKCWCSLGQFSFFAEISMSMSPMVSFLLLRLPASSMFS